MMTNLRELALSVGGSLPASIVAKATVIALLALIGTRLARRSRAAVRHVLLAAAFGALLLLPVASMVAPPVRIAVRNLEQNQGFSPSPSGVDTLPSFVPADSRPAVGPAVSPSVVPWSELWIIVWFAGLAISMIPMVVGLWKIRKRPGNPGLLPKVWKADFGDLPPRYLSQPSGKHWRATAVRTARRALGMVTIVCV